MDAVDDGCNLLVLVGNVLALDEMGGDMSVGGDDQFTHVGKLRTCLCDGDLLTVEVLYLHTLENLVRMTIEHDIDAPGAVYQIIRADA